MTRWIGPATLSMFAVLAACSSGGGGGGGGGGINPPPAPAPSPSPSPTPTPTTNDSLLDLRASQTFDNDAAIASGYYEIGTTCQNCTAARGTLTIRYDAAARSYTVTAPGRTQTFNQGDLDPAQSSAQLNVFVRSTATVDENLSLTRPGTSGPLTFQYVGGGVWQRVVLSATRGDFTFDAFTYGLPTTNAATPRTGFAAYDVSLIGALGSTTRVQPIALSGSGRLSADFASSQILLSGEILGINSELLIQEFRTQFNGNALISGTSNGFAGNFSFFGSQPMTGTLDGRFYGPGAEEVGATFAVNGPWGDAANGFLVGRRGVAGGTQTLASLTDPTTFQVPGSFAGYYRDPATGKLITRTDDWTTPSAINDMSYQGIESLRYTPATRGFELTVRPPSGFVGWPINYGGLSFDQADIVAAQSTDRFTVYQKTEGNRTLRLLAYKPGAGNTELALSYASFVQLQTIDTAAVAARELGFEAWFPYGVATPASQMPRSGTASYSGRLYGTAVPQLDFTPNWSGPRPTDFYDLTGTATFMADFAAGQLRTELSPVGRNRTDGSTHAFGMFTPVYFFTPGSSLINQGVDYPAGAFFGPTANEVGVTFRFSGDGPMAGTSDVMILSGVAVGTRN